MKRMLAFALLLVLLCPAVLAEARPEWCGNYEDVIRLKCDPPRYLAEIEGDWSLLDAEGRIIEERYVSGIGQFYEGIAIAYSPEEDAIPSGFINEAGELITGFDFINGGWYLCSDFSDGLCCVEFAENGLYGCINSAGEIVIEPKYEWLLNFSEGLARFQEDGKYGFINIDDEIVIPPIHAYAGVFHDGRAEIRTENGMCGFIDTLGNVVIEAVFASAGDFSGGLAWVETADGKYGYIRPDGSFAIEPIYSAAQEFRNAYGAVAIPPVGSDAQAPGDDFGSMFQEVLWGLIDASGNVIIPFEYDYLEVQRGVNLAPEEIVAWAYKDKKAHCFLFRDGRAVELDSIIRWEDAPVQEYGAPVIPLDAAAEKPRLQSMYQLERLHKPFAAAAGYDLSPGGAWYYESDVATLVNVTSGLESHWRGFGMMLCSETLIEKYLLHYADEQAIHSVPVARDALVFVVPEDNPIDNLSVEQLKAIHSGEITDWSELGAEEVGKITAYQMEDYEWAQVEFEKHMQDIWRMTPPLEFAEGDYGDYQAPCRFAALPGAIGFEMKSMIDFECTTGLKYLSVDGVAPTAENIGNGSYPFAVNICAMYSEKEDNPNIQILLDWLRSDQGRELIEKSGYVAG